MSDADLRALEHRWRESASVEDETRWHAARLRAGLVTERGLVIAAGLGHEAAARLAPAVGLSPLELLDRPEDPPGPARVRAAIGLVRAMAVLHAELLTESRRPNVAASPAELAANVQAALSAAERWARCPCPEHAEALACFEGVYVNDCVPECCWYREDFPGQLIGLGLNAVAECAGRAPRGGWNFLDAASMFGARSADQPDGLEHAAEEAIRAGVLPWALGLSDPL